MGSAGSRFINFLRNTQCSLGIHVGQFHYEDGRGCVKIRRCTRCDSVESFPAHDLGPWVEQQPRCRLVRSCQRCPYAISKEAHSYGWRSAPNSPCQFQNSCEHCGQTAVFGSMVRHAWGDWRKNYGGLSSTRICERCGAVEAAQSYTGQVGRNYPARNYPGQSRPQQSFRPSQKRNLPNFEGGWYSNDEWQEGWQDGWGAYHPDTDWRWHDSDQEE
jgi:hypothetical protein